MRTVRLFALIALALTVSASTLTAQHRRPGLRSGGPDGRSGFWVVLTGGAGVEQVNFENDGIGFSDPLTRPVLGLRMGGTLSPHWRLGGEVNGWVNESGALTETVGGLLFVAQFYPARRSGLFVKAGAGLGRSAIEDDFGASAEDYGVAGSVGLGWDVRLARHIFLVPSVDFANYRLDAGGGGRYSERITTFGLGIAYQR
jgi:hypothetical protein